MTKRTLKISKPRKTPPKGVVPPQLVGKGFEAHPENRNAKGVPKDAIALRKMIQEMGAEEIEVFLGGGRNSKTIRMTRLERILLDRYDSSRAQKQELLMNYGYGKPAENINITGQVKVIKVTLKSKEPKQEEDTGGSDNGS